jgi:hypothetical protein
VLRFVVRQGMTPVLAGVVVGLVGALLLSCLVATLLFEVTPRDPLTYGLVSALLVATGVAACIVPARQAMRVDVVTALRAEWVNSQLPTPNFQLPRGAARTICAKDAPTSLLSSISPRCSHGFPWELGVGGWELTSRTPVSAP